MIFTKLFLASLALAPALALPAPQNEGEVFSFATWIEGIIENPDGDHLTPDEAVAAWTASLNGTNPSEFGRLQAPDGAGGGALSGPFANQVPSRCSGETGRVQ